MKELMVKPEFSGEVLAQVTSLGTINHNIKEAKEFALLQKEYYSTVVFDDNSVADAKAERVKLNKMEKSISDYRKNIVKEFKKPIDEFETIAKETEKIIASTSDLVDVQIKTFEEKDWLEKVKLIKQNIEVAGLDIDENFNPKWKNKGYEMDTIIEDIIEERNKVDAQLQLDSSNKELIKMYAESKGVNPEVYLVQYDFTKDVTAIKNKIDTSTIVVPEVVVPKVDLFTGEQIITVAFTGTISQIEMLRTYAKTIGLF